MKKLYMFLGVISAAVIPSGAISTAAYADSAQSSWYIGTSGDLTWLEQYGTGGGGNIALGYQFLPSDFGDFRIEAEGGYHATSDAQYYTYMGNLYYDFNGLKIGTDNASKFVPYVGAGLGDATAHLSMDDASGRFSGSDNVFAYQLMAGLTYISASMPNTDWSLGYRYLGSSSTELTDNAGVSSSERLRSNNLELAARFHF